MQVPTLNAWLFSGCKMVASLLLTMPARMASSAAFSLPFCGLGPAMTALQVTVSSCGTTACCGTEILGAAFKTKLKAAVQCFHLGKAGSVVSFTLPSALQAGVPHACGSSADSPPMPGMCQQSLLQSN